MATVSHHIENSHKRQVMKRNQVESLKSTIVKMKVTREAQ